MTNSETLIGVSDLVCNIMPSEWNMKLVHQTEQHLKSYLNANQLHRERMCLAILACDPRFSEVRPIHPMVGPDGGRDIEALFRQEQQAFAAVGFLNDELTTPRLRRHKLEKNSKMTFKMR